MKRVPSFKDDKYESAKDVIRITGGVIKVFAGIAIVGSILVADGVVFYDMTIDHTAKICPLTSILGEEHQLKQINNNNYYLEAFCGTTKSFQLKKPIHEIRSVPYFDTADVISYKDGEKYIDTIPIIKYRDEEIDGDKIYITAKADEIYIVNKKNAEIVNILKLNKK